MSHLQPFYKPKGLELKGMYLNLYNCDLIKNETSNKMKYIRQVRDFPKKTQMLEAQTTTLYESRSNLGYLQGWISSIEFFDVKKDFQSFNHSIFGVKKAVLQKSVTQITCYKDVSTDKIKR